MLVLLVFGLTILPAAGCDVKNDYEVQGDGDMQNSLYILAADEDKAVQPNAYDLVLAQEKGLAGNDIYDGDYLTVRAAYMALLNQYLCRTAGLDEYQKYLDDSEYNFPPEEESVYQKAGGFGRQNIYIRSNAYVERLSEEDLKLLRESVSDSGLAISDELLDMAKRTMQEVITVRYDDSGAEFDAVYDAGVFQTNIAPNNALVLAIAYDFEYDEEGNLISEQTEREKLEFVGSLQKRMIDEMGEKLGIPVSVFY